MAIVGLRDIIFLCFCGIIHFIYRRRQKRLLPLPPSLPGWPIVGNTFQLPLKYVHVFYQDLERKLGSKIMHAEALGQPIIAINDARIASDLLEKRSAFYSSRPRSPMYEVIGWIQFFVFLPHNDEWRNQRRIFQQHFAKRDLPREQEKALEFTHKALLPNLYQTPQDFLNHVKEYVGGMALSMTYGLPVKRNHEPLVKLSEDAFHCAVLAAAPGGYWVNILPFLQHIPDWVPGIPFKKDAQRFREQLSRVLEEPFQMSQKNTDEGVGQECFVSSSLDNKDRSGYEILEPLVKNAASQVFGAASETTITSLLTFILAMLIHPEFQRKAQEELDLVVGTDRLPDFSHKSQLPYLTAVLKEVLRWNPVLPTGKVINLCNLLAPSWKVITGIPHYATADDVYEGYYIPKGATIIANAYAMLHDEEAFPNPKEFNPGRFIKDGVLVEDILDPTVTATFGFGRRVCPGAHIALSTLYIAAASILSLFDIYPTLDENNKPIEVKPEFIADSLISEPLPFPCKITPRHGKDIDDLLAGNMNVEYL
ncbi:hypothetical protein D9756_010405 [Leucocoprinus leucothites]|uniref:Cytochrome P450 n=1 Tax=Leucocoprinus leucothites TaxID=201217 RepID=A0A8H5CRK4_9AGAR|nr:hypothetical protein D9756_010405 [Leucoagaricus leucothites]